MEAIQIHRGKTVSLLNDNIDTDQIIPKVFLKRIEKTGFGEFLFYDWRYLSGEKLNPNFPLNDPMRKGATVLVTGENFGYGSSREHAAWALLDYGFRVIIAGGYSDIFYMNCTKNGILPIILSKKERAELAELGPDETVQIDLPNQTVAARAKTYSFAIDPTWKNKLVEGVDDIAITLHYLDDIVQYEKKQNKKNFRERLG
ncbi:isopropylmalate isomerase small subunit [Listeria floridensis FSL S10-1187]|uniref:3-isopropylmalate dehydratase small subunit n=1 Tax=Listeria floridensis FSL S10-1187 TaxID=1265817 RepID=A0ABP3AU28_9LIST|nr:3-isopropylmalate dehydratase small subunit [Listeria floridensis]EUJ25707.1 isopropylmalate isomerase small subunit [Listeria floridensis FSL S10-1187]